MKRHEIGDETGHHPGKRLTFCHFVFSLPFQFPWENLRRSSTIPAAVICPLRDLSNLRSR